jgi:hypothetical protein
MNLERFKILAEAYGGDIGRWPEAERAAAEGFATANAEAAAWLAEAGSLDDLLDMAPAAPPSDLLRHKVMAAAPRLSRPVWQKGGVWASLAGLAAACVLGLFVGANMPSSLIDDPALESTASTAFDGTTYLDALEGEG